MTRRHPHRASPTRRDRGRAARVAAPAQAGSYTVSGTCGLWAPYNNNGARMAVYATTAAGW